MRATRRVLSSVRCAIWQMCIALIMTSSSFHQARAADVFGTFGNWTVLRVMDRSVQGCSIATRAANGRLRLDLEPLENGGVMIVASVTGGPETPRAADDRIGISWMPRQGQLRVATYPILGSKLLSGPPVRLFVHTILREPAAVKALLNDAFASVGVLVSLDPGYEEPLPTAGFSEAWAALKQCDPARTAALPAN
jgi:hypothetical protein